MSERNVTNNTWKQKWDKGNIGWHVDEVNAHLVQYFHLFDDGNIKGKRILIPLCGMTMDMKWFYDKGMSVVGVDLAESAARGFFDDNGYDYSIEVLDAVPDCKVYRHNDRLSVFVCDIFKLDVASLGGHFDYLWDRAALVALDYEEQKKYWNRINSYLGHNAQGLVSCIEYDTSTFREPPYPITEDILLDIITDTFSVTQVANNLPEDHNMSSVGVPAVSTLYHIKR